MSDSTKADLIELVGSFVKRQIDGPIGGKVRCVVFVTADKGVGSFLVGFRGGVDGHIIFVEVHGAPKVRTTVLKMWHIPGAGENAAAGLVVKCGEHGLGPVRGAEVEVPQKPCRGLSEISQAHSRTRG